MYNGLASTDREEWMDRDLLSATRSLIDSIEGVIIGKTEEVTLIVAGLLAEGHILLEDIPGVGKTMLARSLAKAIGCTFSRIQFTPDLLPADLTGISIYNQATRTFEFRPGPVMAQIVLADEINRATPKTQSALLEAMEERQVTVDGTTYLLNRPFMVLATQNPIEYEGTFPLPEAQLDRFIMRVKLGYPDFDHELTIINAQRRQHPIEMLERTLTVEEMLTQQAAVKDVYVDRDLMSYIVQLVQETRRRSDILLGASPRGSLALFRAAQALALIQGRQHVIPDDIKRLAIPTLSHRLLISPGARMKGVSPEAIIQDILMTLHVPGSAGRR